MSSLQPTYQVLNFGISVLSVRDVGTW